MAERGLRAILAVPANNTTMAHEIAAYCPEIETLEVARVPRVSPRPMTKDDLPQYRDNARTAIAPLRDEPVDLFIYGCTAAGFLAGPAGEAEIVRALASFVGAPAVSTSSSVGSALKHMGVRTVDLVSPYADWKNELLRDFLAPEGIEVVRSDSFRTENAEQLGRITAEQVMEKALATASSEADAMLIACSQLPTLEIIPRLEEALGRPVWSSVRGAGWAASNICRQLRRSAVA